MKKTSFALLMIGILSNVHAGGYTAFNSKPQHFSVPPTITLPNGIFMGATGYYLQPQTSDNDLNYGYVQIGGPNPSSTMYVINPKYRPGYDVFLGYLLPNKMDVMVKYFNYAGQYSRTSAGIAAGTTFTLENPNTDNAVAVDSTISASSKYRINQVDLTVGQSFVDCNTLVHPFLGLRWSELDRYLKTYGVFNSDGVETIETTTVATVLNRVREKSHFSGIGPILGFDGRYRFQNGFELLAHLDGALLIGKIFTKNWQGSTGTPADVAVTTTTNTYWRERSSNRIVPVTDLKLGAAFSADDGDDCMAFRVEGGYQVSYYFNSVNRLLANGSGTFDANFTAAINGGAQTANVGFQGPYLNLSVAF